MADTILVLQDGAVVENGATGQVVHAPRHPYTRALLDAAPDLDPARRTAVAAARGELPSPLAVPSGCPFHTRCLHAFDRCRTERPLLAPRGAAGRAACHLADFGAPA